MLQQSDLTLIKPYLYQGNVVNIEVTNTKKVEKSYWNIRMARNYAEILI